MKFFFFLAETQLRSLPSHKTNIQMPTMLQVFEVSVAIASFCQDLGIVYHVKQALVLLHEQGRYLDYTNLWSLLLALIICVTLGKSLDLPEFQCPHLYLSQGLLEDLYKKMFEKVPGKVPDT